MTYQTITEGQQDRILKHLSAARDIFYGSKCDNLEKEQLQDALSELIHRVQLAQTKRL